MNQSLKDLYYSPKTGFSGLVKLYKKAKERDPTITLSDVKAFLDRQYAFQINRQDIRPKFYRTILAKAPKDNYQMDIMVYSRYPDGAYKYMLNVVDVHSRYAMSVPLKARTVGQEPIEALNVDDIAGGDDTLVTAIDKVFKKMGIPKNVNSDQEFSRPLAVQRYFQDKGVTHHISETDEINKQAIVERFNRTLALLLKRWRDGTGRKDWHNVLDDLVDNYNKSYHRTLKGRPIDVWNGDAENKQTPIHMFEAEIEVGDLVRLKLVRDIFSKGDSTKYSEEVYVVVEKKDAVENGRKLKKFRLKNVDTNHILTKPREWWKDYELKKVDSIVERQTENEDYEQKKTQALEDELQKVKAKEKETVDAIEVRKKRVEELRKSVNTTTALKTAKEAITNQYNKSLDQLKTRTTIPERLKLLDTLDRDTLKALGKTYGLKQLSKFVEPDNIFNLNYRNKDGRWTYKPNDKLKETLIAVELSRDLIYEE
jgi:hypothetical protein